MSFYVKGAKASKWCNPFSVKKYGLEECLRLYKEHLINNLTTNKLNLAEICDDDVELGCWCEDLDKCHLTILQQEIETYQTKI